MKSGLSSEVSNAKFYDQASRNIACMCKTLEISATKLVKMNSIGFFVIAPENEINGGVFSKFLDKQHIKKTVKDRVSQYEQEDIYLRMKTWYENQFLPFIERIDVGCIKWENAIDRIEDKKERRLIQDFYNKCLEFN